ncbi:MAG: hypothetical protein IPG75_18205 [Gemmatimonadetes bacterium]|jgi:hypothetical protein|nr:hypothetical protein [Gemmatimonadota bacterium]
MSRRLPRSVWRALLAAVLSLATQPLLAQGAPSRPFLELSAWGVYSRFSNPPRATASDKADGVGMRSVELAVWPAASLRLFGRYDNSLSLDNLSLLRAGRRVPTWSGGALLDWGGRFTTVVQVGRRTLPGRVGQTLLGLEQVAYTAGGTAWKAGVEVGPRADDRIEWVGHAGVNLPVTGRLRVEPVVFYARSGLGAEAQWRALLAGELGLGGASALGGGMAVGRISDSPAGLDGTVWDGHARLTVGTGAGSRAHLLLRHERAPGASPLTSVAVGLSFAVRRP